MKGIFDYVRPQVPKDCIYAISPSGIGRFFDYPKTWYEEELLGKEREFKGSTSTVLGTICHYIYEHVTNKQEVNREAIDRELAEFVLTNPDIDIDTEAVLKDYPEVSRVVVNEYVLPHSYKAGVVHTEQPVVAKVMDGIYVTGTTDRIEDDLIVDYKTVSVKPNETCIPFNYKIQLLAYAYAVVQQMKLDIRRIRIVYGVRPTKKLPARCFVVTEEITPESWKLISDTLALIGESVKAVKDNVKLAYLIFKSYDLKE